MDLLMFVQLNYNNKRTTNRSLTQNENVSTCGNKENPYFTWHDADDVGRWSMLLVGTCNERKNSKKGIKNWHLLTTFTMTLR